MTKGVIFPVACSSSSTGQDFDSTGLVLVLGVALACIVFLSAHVFGG